MAISLPSTALGEQLAASQTSDEARLIGRSLQLSTRRPSDDFIYLVDGQPVIAAWGYEPDALASLQGFVPPTVPTIAPPAAPPVATPAGCGPRERAGDRACDLSAGRAGGAPCCGACCS